jgi:hypothetical protein
MSGRIKNFLLRSVYGRRFNREVKHLNTLTCHALLGHFSSGDLHDKRVNINEGKSVYDNLKIDDKKSRNNHFIPNEIQKKKKKFRNILFSMSTIILTLSFLFFLVEAALFLSGIGIPIAIGIAVLVAIIISLWIGSGALGLSGNIVAGDHYNQKLDALYQDRFKEILKQFRDKIDDDGLEQVKFEHIENFSKLLSAAEGAQKSSSEHVRNNIIDGQYTLRIVQDKSSKEELRIVLPNNGEITCEQAINIMNN